jgi:hypothetical protein
MPRSPCEPPTVQLRRRRRAVQPGRPANGSRHRASAPGGPPRPASGRGPVPSAGCSAMVPESRAAHRAWLRRSPLSDARRHSRRPCGGHISENPLVDGHEAEAQADPRDLAFVSVQPHLKIGPDRPFKGNRSCPSGAGSRRLELARSDRPDGSRRSLDMSLSCRLTDPMEH